MGSTRLPGKVLLDLGGDTVLARVVHRVRRSKMICGVVVATTRDSRDDAIIAECRRIEVECFRGEELDVLDRYQRSALSSAADAVVRITSDCPLIEPEVSDKVIQAFLDQRIDRNWPMIAGTLPRVKKHIFDN